MNQTVRTWVQVTLGAVFAAMVSSAVATDFPVRQVRLVVPVAAGGPNDTFARTLAPRLGVGLGQQLVIENIPGAGGNLATASVLRQPHDGHNLVLHGMTYAVNPSIFGAASSYKIGDYTAVSIVAKGPLVLVVHPSLGVKSVKELIAYLKSKPNGVDYASGGPGTSPHLAAELFKLAAGANMQHIPYKGTGAFMPDLLAGRVPVAFVSPLVIKPSIESGQLIGLGVTSAQRSKGWDLPTIAEAGVPGFDFEAWYAIMTPAATPADVVLKLNKIVDDAVNTPEAQEKWQSLGVEVMRGTPQEAQAYVMSEYAKWARVVKAANIKAD